MPNRDPALGDGSSLIPLEVIGALPDDVSVVLLTFAGDVPIPAQVARRCDRVEVLPLRGSRRALARSVLSRYPIGTEERLTPAACAAVFRLSRAVDVTLLHGPHAAPLAAVVSGAVVVQVVDPWSLRVAMEVDLATGWRRHYRARKARLARQAERDLPERARLLTVGRSDADAWSAALRRPVRSIPNGVHAAPVSRRPGPPTICFVGSLNYAPNVESATVLVREVAPLVWAEAPGTRVVLAGRRPVAEVLALAGERVEVLGDVPSIGAVFAGADVAVFPDRHGLGVRNSVTEALAAGLPVVATPAAAREQPDSPLLGVASTTPELAALARAALAAPRRGGAAGSQDVRTWRTVAQEYREECEAAVRQG